MKPKFEQLKKYILFEQSQIDIVIAKIKEIKGIDELNTTALAAYLMNFYNGIENIVKRCAKEYYKKMPKGEDWHKLLLEQSCLQNNKDKVALFGKETADKLYNYLTFRHFFIHGYGFRLNRQKIEPLVDGIDKLWHTIKEQLAEFMEKI